MLLHRGFPTTPTDRTICALSLAPSRAPPWARARARACMRWPQPAPRADPPGERAASAFPVRRDATTSVAVGAAEVRGPERVKRWRRDQIHFSPERARAVRRAPARRNGRSRATRRAERGERCEPGRTHQPTDGERLPSNRTGAGLKGADRSSCPGDASTAGTRRAASRDRRAVGGFEVTAPVARSWLSSF